MTGRADIVISPGNGRPPIIAETKTVRERPT